jgi:S1-C subfamily serine protease
VEAAEVKVFQDLKNVLEGKKPNDVITLKVRRGEETLEMKLTLGTRRVPVGD